jgi:hypothetical protein
MSWQVEGCGFRILDRDWRCDDEIIPVIAAERGALVAVDLRVRAGARVVSALIRCRDESYWNQERHRWAYPPPGSALRTPARRGSAVAARGTSRSITDIR